MQVSLHDERAAQRFLRRQREDILHCGFPGVAPLSATLHAGRQTFQGLFGADLWMMADIGSVTTKTDGSSAGAWNDVTGNARHWSLGGATNNPVYRATLGPGGGPCLEFGNNPTGVTVVLRSYQSGPNMTGLATNGAEIFLRLKAHLLPGFGSTGQWGPCFHQDPPPGPLSDLWMFEGDGFGYQAWGSTTRRGPLSWTGHTAEVQAWHVLNMRSASNDWQLWVNGTNRSSSGVNTTAFRSAPALGQSNNAANGWYGWMDFIAIVNAPAVTTQKRLEAWRLLGVAV